MGDTEINFLTNASVDPKEIKKMIFNKSPEQVFELYFSDNAIFSLGDHFSMKGLYLIFKL